MHRKHRLLHRPCTMHTSTNFKRCRNDVMAALATRQATEARFGYLTAAVSSAGRLAQSACGLLLTLGKLILRCTSGLSGKSSSRCTSRPRCTFHHPPRLRTAPRWQGNSIPRRTCGQNCRLGLLCSRRSNRTSDLPPPPNRTFSSLLL